MGRVAEMDCHNQTRSYECSFHKELLISSGFLRGSEENDFSGILRRIRNSLLLLEPSLAVDLHEVFRSWSSCQTHPERPTFAFKSEIDVKEWAAQALLYDPFGNQGKRRLVRWK